VVSQLIIQAMEGVPMVAFGDDLQQIVETALADNHVSLQNGDILVLAQKIVSKSEGCLVDLNQVKPSAEAQAVAKKVDKDPRLVEVILSQSQALIRQVKGVLITQHLRGWVMANSGIDASNVNSEHGQDNILLLPKDPDSSCEILRNGLYKSLGVDVAVVINDSFGRPWRLGTTGVAIGAAGLPSLWDRRGDLDLFGRKLLTSQQAVADEIAGAASLLQGQADEGRPIVLIRGLTFPFKDQPEHCPASDLVRDIKEDLFR
jgi:coenzyme F420-0:L-glutamate ligase / coenzyme F420-1:gamma-L-glutamate ligase